MSSSTSSSPKEETYDEDREFESQAKRLKTEEGEIVYSAEESESRQEATPRAGSDSDSGGGGDEGDGGEGGGGEGGEEEGDGEEEEGDGGEEGDDGDEGGSGGGGGGGDEGGSGGPRSVPQSMVTKRGRGPSGGRAGGPGVSRRGRRARPRRFGLVICGWLAFPESRRRRAGLGFGASRGAEPGAGVGEGRGGRASLPLRDAVPRALGGLSPLLVEPRRLGGCARRSVASSLRPPSQEGSPGLLSQTAG